MILKNQNYTFQYQVSDYRGVSSYAELQIQPVATPPNLEEVSDFTNLSHDWLTDTNNTLEYGVLSSEFLNWVEVSQTSATDGLEGSPLNAELSVISYTNPNGVIQNSTPSAYEISKYQGQHILRFRAVDSRFSEVQYPEEWDEPTSLSSLTREKEITIKVVATQPEISVFYHDKRDNLSADNDAIKYLVDIKNSDYEDKYQEVYATDFSRFSDFTSGFIIEDGSTTNLQSGKLYYTAQAFNGENLSSDVVVTENVDTSSITSSNPTEISISVDDSSQRDLLTSSDEFPQVSTELNPMVYVVDVLPPILELDTHEAYVSGDSENNPMEIEGILENLTLVNEVIKIR